MKPFRITLSFAWLILLGTTFSGLAAGFNAQARRQPNGRIEISFPADAASYHRVFAGTDVLHVDQLFGITTGTTVVMPTNELSQVRFFRIERVPRATAKDSDNDCLTDLEELQLGTDPLNADTDKDGLSDGSEAELGTDPKNPISGTTAAFQPFTVGSFRVKPVKGTLLTAHVEAGFIGCPQQLKIKLDPANFELLDTAGGVVARGKIHGVGGPAESFSWDSRGAWSAQVDLDGGSTLPLHGDPPVRIESASSPVLSATLEGQGLDSAKLTFLLPDSVSLVAFTGAQQQRFTYKSGSRPSLVLQADRRFDYRGVLRSNLGVPPWNFATLRSGADFHVTNVPGFLFEAGGTLDVAMPAIGFATGGATFVRWNASGIPDFSLTGKVSPFRVGDLFQITGATADTIAVDINSQRIRLPNGARLYWVHSEKPVVPIPSERWIGTEFDITAFDVGGDGTFDAAVQWRKTQSKLRAGALELEDIRQAHISRTAGGLMTLTLTATEHQFGFGTTHTRQGTVRSDGELSLTDSTAVTSSDSGWTFLNVSYGTGGNVFNGQVWFDISALLSLPGEDDRNLHGHWESPTAAEMINDLAAQPLHLGPFHLSSGKLVFKTKSLNVDAPLKIPGFADMQLKGTIGVDGTYEIPLPALPSFSLPPFTMPSADLRLVRQPGNYAAVVSGGKVLNFGDDPFAHWRLGELPASPEPAVADSIRNPVRAKHPGTWVGKTDLGSVGALVGDADRSANFHGGAYVLVPGSESAMNIGNTPNFSAEAWFRVTSFVSDWQAIVTKGDTSWRLHRLANTDRIAFGTGGTGGIGYDDLASSIGVADGKWHQVVGVYDGFCKYLYLDGVLDAWEPYTAGIPDNNFPVMIGNNAESAGRMWTGGIDEVSLYHRALTPGEVTDHFLAAGGTALRVGGTLSLQNAGFGQLNLRGSIGSRGEASLQAEGTYTLRGFEFRDGYLSLTRTPAQGPTLWMGGSLYLPNLLSGPVSGFRGSLSSALSLDFRAQALRHISLIGFPFTNFELIMQGSLPAGAARISLCADSTLASQFPNRRLCGEISLPESGGYVDLEHHGDVQHGGFGGSGSMHLTGHSPQDAQLGVKTWVNLDPATSYGVGGQIDFSGNADAQGGLVLYGSSTLKFGDYTLDRSIGLTLSADGIRNDLLKPSEFKFGDLHVPIVDFKLQTGGLTLDAHKEFSTGWKWFGPLGSHPAAKVSGTAKVRKDGEAIKTEACGTIDIEWLGKFGGINLSTETDICTGFGSEGGATFSTSSKFSNRQDWDFKLTN